MATHPITEHAHLTLRTAPGASVLTTEPLNITEVEHRLHLEVGQVYDLLVWADVEAEGASGQVELAAFIGDDIGPWVTYPARSRVTLSNAHSASVIGTPEPLRVGVLVRKVAERSDGHWWSAETRVDIVPRFQRTTTPVRILAGPTVTMTGD